MRVRLFDGSIRTSPSMLERVTERVSRALAHVAQRVMDVTVRIADENGEKHGATDKRCRIVAQISRAQAIVVEARHEDYYAAIDAASAKLQRAAEHRFRER